MRSFSGLCIRHPLQVTVYGGFETFHYALLCLRQVDLQIACHGSQLLE
jgi:hypothetical protein